jgi:hypothetical protein
LPRDGFGGRFKIRAPHLHRLCARSPRACARLARPGRATRAGSCRLVLAVLDLAAAGRWPGHLWLLPRRAAAACHRAALPPCLLSLTDASASLCAAAPRHCCAAAAAGPRSAPSLSDLWHCARTFPCPPRLITHGGAEPSPAHPVSLSPLSAVTGESLRCFGGGRSPSPNSSLPWLRHHVVWLPDPTLP